MGVKTPPEDMRSMSKQSETQLAGREETVPPSTIEVVLSKLTGTSPILPPRIAKRLTIPSVIKEPIAKETNILIASVPKPKESQLTNPVSFLSRANTCQCSSTSLSNPTQLPRVIDRTKIVREGFIRGIKASVTDFPDTLVTKLIVTKKI